MKRKQDFGFSCKIPNQRKMAQLLKGNCTAIDIEPQSILPWCNKHFESLHGYMASDGFTRLIEALETGITKKKKVVLTNTKVERIHLECQFKENEKTRQIVSLSGTFTFNYKDIFSGLAINIMSPKSEKVAFNLGYDKNKKVGYLFLYQI